MEEPKLTGAVVLATIAIVLVVPAWRMTDLPDWLRITLALLGGVLLVFSGLIVMQWALNQWDKHALATARAAAITSDSEVVRMYSNLSPMQCETLLRRSAAIVYKPAVAGPEALVDVDGVMVPVEFVHDFLETSTDEHLTPVRNYGEGTNYRKWAQAITDFYITRGICGMAVGNRPARWRVSREQGLLWFGMALEEA